MKKNVSINYCGSMEKRVKLLSGLLVLLLVICSSVAVAADNSPVPVLMPENPELVKYQDSETSIEPEPSLDGHEPGIMPEPVDLSYIDEISIADSTAPAYYDLRNLDRVTTVKDQGSAGTCWAFATYASLESYLMSGENRDFSENNMKNLLSSAYPEGFDRDPNAGGNRLQATAYLTRWSGPVQENDDPYSVISGVSPEGLSVKKHVQNVLFIPKRTNSLDNEAIKWAVENYGAIYTSMYYNNTYYSPANCTYYFNGTTGSNHAVGIVGWDDSFSRDKFSEVPPGDGAFIMKNSWGSEWGENGYFYVSYYDSKIGNENAVFTAEDTDNYESVYQYDPLGWTGSLGYTNLTTAWCANTFTAKSNEALKAVSFYTTDSNCNYEIYIYTNPTAGPINQDGYILSKKGTSLTAGYNTVPLGSDIRLTTGQNFSVVLRLTNSEYKYPIALEKPVSGYSSKATASAGQSFISSNGQTWKDIVASGSYPNTNVCIKAFTNSVLLPTANFSTNVTEGYVPLSVQFDDLSQNSVSYNWDFENDGISDSTEQNTVHVYTTPGNYTVNLTASNENGTDSKLSVITVMDKPLPPVASFRGNVTSGYAPLTVQFTDLSTDSAEWIWDFGDKTYSTDRNPVHTYLKSGKYTVNLTVKNSEGTDAVSKAKYISVFKQK